MRAGICSVQQALTVEAANIVKQAVTLARRRGHAQVTPLHVASAMLASTNGLLRRACLQSHSHPLHCKALELCFNVALNRLPASTSSPFLGPHSSYPSLSNALVAAFKRAQAHQRRGSIENQQQPILALKIEIEQLVISILDDPSVSRVMRESGFSSTQVKNKVEQAVSLEICSQSSTRTSRQTKEITKSEVFSTNSVPQFLPFSHYGVPPSKPTDHEVCNDDVMSVLNTLMQKKRNMVITGECVSSAETVARGVMGKIERGHAPGELRSGQFVSFPLVSLRDLSKEEIEQKLMELRCTVKSYVSKGVVIYIGDLEWVAEFWSGRSYHCYAEYIIMELKRMVRGIGENERIWLVGIATLQSYMKFKAGYPSLETIWELYPHTVPNGSLSLSLNIDGSKASSNPYSWPVLESPIDNHLTSSAEFSVNFNREAQTIGCSTQNEALTTSSSLPLWLKQHKQETERIITDYTENGTKTSPPLEKWNSFGSLVRKESHYAHNTMKFASSPTSPVSISSHECNQTHLGWPAIFKPRKFQNELKICMSECDNDYKSNLITAIKPELLSNPNSSPNSASSSEAMDDTEGLPSFKVLNEQNLQILCSSLERKVPWQKNIIPDIATTVLECRSRIRKKGEEREETWLFFLGIDSKGKEQIARELARLVYGSQTNFVSIGLSNFSSTEANSTENSNNKRRRDELASSYHERLGIALNENPHRVFFMEDAEQLDHFSQKAIKRAMKSGKVELPGGENVPLKDAMVIFSCESFSSMSRACSPSRKLNFSKSKVKVEEDEVSNENHVILLDLNVDADDGNEESNIAENGILQYVDRKITFKIQDL